MPIVRILLFVTVLCTLAFACDSEGPAPEPTPVPVKRISAEYTHLPETLLEVCRDAATLAEMPEGPDRFVMASYLDTKQPCPSEGTLIRIMGDVSTTHAKRLFGLGTYPLGTIGLGIALPFGQDQWGRTDEWLIETGVVLLGMSDEGLEVGDAISALCTVGQPVLTGMGTEGYELNNCELEQILAKVPPTPTPVPYVWASDQVSPTPTPVPVSTPRPRREGQFLRPTPYPTVDPALLKK